MESQDLTVQESTSIYGVEEGKKDSVGMVRIGGPGVINS